MAVLTLTCPACRATFKRDELRVSGYAFTCPKCVELLVGGEDGTVTTFDEAHHGQDDSEEDA